MNTTRTAEVINYDRRTFFLNAAAALLLGLAVTASATAAMAKSRAPHPGQAAQAQAAIDESVRASPERAQALRECNVLVEPLKDYSWGSITPITRYRVCMEQHGQPE